MEIQLDESSIKPEDELLDIDFIYDDINTNKKITINAKYIYAIKDLNFAKANEEYIRSQTYDVLEKAVKLRENDKLTEGKEMLKKMREWLEKNYHGENKNYLEDIKKAEPMFERREYEQRDFTYATSQIRQMQSKRTGDLYINRVQRELRHTYQNNYIQSQKINKK